METLFTITNAIFISILTASVGVVVKNLLNNQPLSVAFIVIATVILVLCLLGFIKWRLS